MGNHYANRTKAKDELIAVKVRQEDCQVGNAGAKGRDSIHVIDMKSISLMLPVWYTAEELTPDDMDIAKRAWNMILLDTSTEFLRLKGTQGFPYTASVVWFFDTFYHRLFDIHPSVRPLFKNGLVTQGKFLVQMISMLLRSINDEKAFDETLYKLVVTHNARGVKVSEYGLVGEVLFYSLHHCLGPAYTVDVSKAWIKVFSRMLKYIVPKAIALELSTASDAQNDRFRSYDNEMRTSEQKESEIREKLLKEMNTDSACPFSHEGQNMDYRQRERIESTDPEMLSEICRKVE